MNKIFDLLVVIILTFRYLGDCIFMQFPQNSLKFHIGKDKEIFSKKPKKTEVKARRQRDKRKKPKKEQKMSIKGIGKAENKANESRLIKNNRSC